MVENKRQHFVSKFYLKHFSPDTDLPPAERKTINLLNIRRGKIIERAGLKEQCYRDYFYGKDGIKEKQFAELEGMAQVVFRRIGIERKPPSYHSIDHVTMVLFVHLQSCRTVESARRIRETDEKFNAEIMSLEASEDAKVEALVVRENHVNASLRYSQKHFPLLLDLECKLLVAGNGLEFLTCDNPTVLYNQLFEFSDAVSFTGLQSLGLQVFFPINPKLMLVMYDTNVYHVGNRGNRVVEITSRKDLRALNALQVASASSNCYFQSAKCEPFIALQQGKPYIRKELAKLFVRPETHPDGSSGKLIGLSTVDIKTNLRLSFIGIKKAAHTFVARYRQDYKKPLVVMRNREFYNAHEYFIRRVRSGELLASQYQDVLGKFFFMG